MPNKKGVSSAAPSFVQQTIKQLGQDRSASPQKRRRQQSGEPVGTLDQIKELIETQMSEFGKLKEEFQGIADTMKAELSSLKERMKDLEDHTNRKDEELDNIEKRLRLSEEKVGALQKQIEENEVISRLPTLIFSGPAVEKTASPPRLARPAGDRLTLAGSTSPAAPRAGGPGREPGADPEPEPDRESESRREEAGLDATEQQRRTEQPTSYAGAAAAPARDGDRRDGSTAAGPPPRQAEDVEATLISLLNSAFPGLDLQRSDIERAHRTGKKIWCRFVKSGAGSVRDQLYNGRLSLRGNRKGDELYISECLTKARQEIFGKLLALKKEKKIYTVFSRYGSVFVKEQQYGRNVRVDDMAALQALGATAR